MTLALQRQRLIVRLLVLGCFAAFAHVSVHAMVVVGGDSPIQDMGWPKGVVEVANLPSRYRWIEGPPFGGGEYRFEYQGYAQDFNESLRLFAQIRAPKLELAIHDGPGRNYAANDDEQQGVDWAFAIWVPRSFYRLYKSPTSHSMADAPGYGEPLPPPRIDVYVWKGGSINWKDVVIPAGIDVIDERAATAGITPVGGGVLVGSAYDMRTGKPVEGAVVSLLHYGQGSKPETTPTATVDEDGAFQVERIPKGSYRVHIEAAGYAPREAGYYVNRDLTYEKMVVYLAQSAAVEGTVVDSEGNPAVGAQVHARTPVALDGKGYRLINEPGSAVTDGEGRFKFTGLPEGYIHLWCSGDWHSKTMFELQRAPSDAIRLTAARTGTIRGTLIDSSGTPVSGTVRLVPKGDPVGRWHASGEADDDGRFEIRNVPPDDYLLGTGQALERGEEDRTAQNVSLKPGEQVIMNVVASEEPEFEQEAEEQPLKIVGQEAPELDVAVWVNGEPTTLAALRGKTVVLAFWDRADEKCADLVPVLNGLMSGSSRSRIEVVSVHGSESDLDALKQFISDRQMKYRVAVDKAASERPFKGATFQKYSVRSVPAIFIVDREGKIRYHDIALPAVEEAVKALLAE